MIHENLISPKSIVVVGGSDQPGSPGEKILSNLLENNYNGNIFVVNPKKKIVKNLPTYKSVIDLPKHIDLAIIAISSKYVYKTVKILTEEKNTRAFIIISAGFSDIGKEGKELEDKIIKQIELYKGSLLGPNNIGLINRNYTGVFISPIPKLNPKGIDLISGSGATAVFIIEAANKMGITFNSIWSVGNSAQIGIEEVLEYLDQSHKKGDSTIKMLYIESIKKPKKFLKHCRSLIEKNCQIIAIKAGSSVAGSRAASSHTGALATPDIAIDALFDKAGVLRAYGRNELIYLAAILQYGLPKNNNMAIVTHAGGPGVMLTDVLENNGINVPEIYGDKANQLKEKLFYGSSVSNPIDFLATGTAQQLDEILTAVENDFKQIDASAVIFGSPGLFKADDVYETLLKHINRSKKPIYPILPSVINVADEIESFHQKGKASFPDEVLFGQAFAKAFHHQKRINNVIKKTIQTKLNKKKKKLFKPSYLSFKQAHTLIQEFDIPIIKEGVYKDVNVALRFWQDKFPVVLKSVGILHKSDKNAVRLNIKNDNDFKKHFKELLFISPEKKVLVQEQKKGIELFAGVKKEKKFGHLILFGMGGIYIETLKDFQTILAPATELEIRQKLKQLKMYPVFKGIRGQKGIDIEAFIRLILNISIMIETYPEIEEIDFNPILATEKEIWVVDNRIKIGH